MNIFTRIGNWVDKRFPEKITTQEVKELIESNLSTLHNHQIVIDNHSNLLAELLTANRKNEEKLLKIETELNAFKTRQGIQNRVAPPTINAFATNPLREVLPK